MKKWNEETNRKLLGLYQRYNVTSDSLIKDHQLLSEFTQKLNQEIGRNNFSEKDVAGQLLKLRKSKKLPRLRH